MLQALDFYISEQKKPADEAFLNQIKEKAGKTNNPDLLLPVAMMELKAGRKEQALAALREGIACGSGGCVYYAFRTEIAGFAPVKKAVEIKFWPVIVKAGFNIKIVALARNKELSPAQSEVVTLCDDFLKTTERVELSIKGNMGSARGSFLIFEDKICYFPANKENPDNVTVNGKKWKNLAFPFSLNKKVYPCMVGKAEINNINHHHFWRDSISIYPKSDSDFEMTAVLVKK